MKIYEYKDYEDYLKHQAKHNEIKFGKIVYVGKHTINEICKHKGCEDVTNILCHGTRSGHEQQFFLEYFEDNKLNTPYVIGSEIGPSANYEGVSLTVQHDFNKPRSEWVGKFDIVYSNSFDHSIVPIECLNTWKEQLNSTGTIYIEYSQNQNHEKRVSESDPLGASYKELEQMIKEAGLNVIDKITRHTKGRIKHNGVVYVLEKK